MMWGERIDAANRQAIQAMVACRPIWIDVQPAREVASDMGERDIFHAGPPVTWERMCGTMRGAVVAAILFEGWAENAEHALRMGERGGIRLSPNHEHGGVGPMAGVVSPSMPVFLLEDRSTSARCYAALEEPQMNFGAHDDSALAVRHYWRDTLAPSLSRALQATGGMNLGRIIARCLHRGDDMHVRSVAATSVMTAELFPSFLEAGVPRADAQTVIRHLAEEENFFHALALGACKLAATAASHVTDCTVVTAMASNGTEFGVRVSGLGDRWFTTAAPVAKGLMRSGFSDVDAGRDIGDAAITETLGLGAFSIAAAPAIFEMMGVRAASAQTLTEQMRGITVGIHPAHTLPLLDFTPAPLGIDIRRVVEANVLPVLGAAIAHREGGYPLIGTGLFQAPRECFVSALTAFAEERGLQ